MQHYIQSIMLALRTVYYVNL